MAAAYSSANRKFTATSCCVTVSSSAREITEARLVSLSRVMNSFADGGIMTRTACGTIT